MFKRLATAALVGIASAAAASSPSISVCTETSTLIYRSTTAYSTYYVTHTLESGSWIGGYGTMSSSAAVPTETSPPATTVSDVTTIYTTTCPAESTYTSGSETLTSTYTTVSTLTSSYQSTITLSSSAAGGIGSYIISPGPYPTPSGNATNSGLPSASSGHPVQQTGNAGVGNKPLSALLGLAGMAAALL